MTGGQKPRAPLRGARGCQRDKPGALLAGTGKSGIEKLLRFPESTQTKSSRKEKRTAAENGGGGFDGSTKADLIPIIVKMTSYDLSRYT